MNINPTKKRKKGAQINLLPSQEFSQTTLGRFLNWITSTFRLIVIVTELFVMIAFLSRFWLDAKINDQKDEITNKQAAINLTMDFEREFRNLQYKLKLYKEIESSLPPISNWLNNLTTSLPTDVYLTSINYTEKNGLSIQGISGNEISIQQTLANIKAKDNFAGAFLSEIKTGEENFSVLNFKIWAISRSNITTN
ncbi:MAG: PilN domain-containing protein [Patescibacteria group bacterium]|nr:PilN domain-containing protein [Patescibacteria group bacterium]